MRQLSEIRFELNEIHSAIGVWQKDLANPNAPGSVLVGVRSLQKRAEHLENELLTVSRSLGVDVCSYRLFAANESQPQVAGVAGSMGTFQHALSTVFDALTDRPKERARFSPITAQATALTFAYSFAGSAGFVFTIQDEKLLFDDVDTKLGESVRLLFEITRARDSDSIGSFVPRVGHGGIRAVRSWVKSHVDSGLGADVEWHRNEAIVARLFKQPAEWRELQRIIDKTSEEKTERVTLEGELYAANLKSRTFAMRFETGEDITGSFGDAISEAHKAELPSRYIVVLDVTTKIHYSLQENEISYFLSEIEPA